MIFKKYSPHSILVLSVLACALSPVVQAQLPPAPPDAGQTLRELQQREIPLERSRPTLALPAENEMSEDPGARVLVNRFQIQGAAHIPEDQLQALLADLQGRELTLGELRGAARILTAHYRNKGFVVARAYLPPQDIVDNSVTIMVLEGGLNSFNVNNRSLVRTSAIEGVLAAQKLTGNIIRSAATDRAMLLLADLPGIGKVAGNLKPGDRVGTSDLAVEVDPGQRVAGELSVDNFGNRYTGEYRFNAQVDLNSPFGLGDRLGFRTTLSDENLIHGRLAYDLPIGSDGLRAGAALTSSHYELAEEFARLDADGVANVITAYASYPLIRRLDRNVWLNGNFERRDLKDEIHSIAFRTDKSASVGSLDVSGDFVDNLLRWGGGYTTWRIVGSAGDLSFDSAAARAADALGPQTEGSYQKAQLSLSRLQSVARNTQLFVTVSGQLASQNLDSSEKFVLGGAYGVRAYPQGEASGDEGVLGNLEVRQRLTRHLQGSVFYDHGHVKISHRRYVPGDNTREIGGYGVGLRGVYASFSAAVFVAWRSTDEATSAPDRSPRITATSSWRF